MGVSYRGWEKKRQLYQSTFPSLSNSFMVMKLSNVNFLFFFSSLISWIFNDLWGCPFDFPFSVRLEQGTVTSLVGEKGTIRGVQYKTKTGQELTSYAPLTIVCDGCFSNLRRSLCDPKVVLFVFPQLLALNLFWSLRWTEGHHNLWQVENHSCFVGLVLENCDLPHANLGHVILADPSPVLFYPISSTEVRCLVDVPGQKVPSVASGEMAHYLKTVVAPQVWSIIYFDTSFRFSFADTYPPHWTDWGPISVTPRFPLSCTLLSLLRLTREISRQCQTETCLQLLIPLLVHFSWGMHSTCATLWLEEEWPWLSLISCLYATFSGPCLISMMLQHCANISNASTLYVRWAREVNCI